MQTPSGTFFSDADVQLIQRMGECGFIRYCEEPIDLRGHKSHVYVFGREDLTDNPDLLLMVGGKIAQVVYAHCQDDRQPCLIGWPVTGNTLAAAASMASVHLRKDFPAHERPPMIAHRVMRQQPKDHGAVGHKQAWVHGRPNLLKHCYWTVDNVATDGQTKIDNAPILEAEGYPVKQMPTLIYVDRQQGAVPRLRAAGFDQVHVVFDLLDLTYVFVELKLWSKSVASAVEEEIRANQFLV